MTEGQADPKALVAITGATGFIGRHLVRELSQRGYRIRVLLRQPVDLELPYASAVIGDLARPQNLSAALQGVDAVIHSAGVAHGVTGLPEADHRLLNAEATRHLAHAAQRARCKRFIFLSSIRAQTGPAVDKVVTEDRPAEPTDAYGRSKLEAEKGLAELDIDWVALRPVLVYGAGAKGNLAALAKLARSPYPLPFAGLDARRSLLSVDNLVHAVDAVLTVATPLRRPLIVADKEALTIAEMVTAMRRGLGRRPGLIAVPAPLLRLALKLGGQPERYERLARPLIADPSALIALGWNPRVSTGDGLADFMKA